MRVIDYQKLSDNYILTNAMFAAHIFRKRAGAPGHILNRRRVSCPQIRRDGLEGDYVCSTLIQGLTCERTAMLKKL